MPFFSDFSRKVNRMLLFPIFNEKIDALMPRFCQKNRPFSEQHTVIMPMFWQKNVLSNKNTYLQYHIFQIFHEKPPAFIPNLVKKLHFCQNSTLHDGPIKTIRCPFFRIFHEKITAQMRILWQKNFDSQKTDCSHAYNVEKTPTLSKTR